MYSGGWKLAILGSSVRQHKGIFGMVERRAVEKHGDTKSGRWPLRSLITFYRIYFALTILRRFTTGCFAGLRGGVLVFAGLVSYPVRLDKRRR